MDGWRPKAILFDLDGTLVESAHIWFQLLRATSKHLGYSDIPYDSWKSTFGQSMQKNRDLFFPNSTQAEVNKYCDEHYVDFIEHLSVLPGAVDALHHCRQLVQEKMVICTNCPEAITKIILNFAKFEEYFGANVVCSGNHIPHQDENSSSTRPLMPKPNPDMLLHACQQLGIEPTDALFIGDSIFDVQAGHAAGCRVVGIGVEGGHITVQSVSELISLFPLV